MSLFINLKASYQQSPRLWLVRSMRFIAFSLAIAIVHGIMSKLTMSFATLPGKVAAVWLPSGLATALVAWFGVRALPGIALGSLVGLLPDLLTLDPPLSCS
jgi:integral membrane sensor domain MASE1